MQFHGTLRWSGERALVQLELLGGRAEQGSQQGCNASALATSGRTIKEQVGKACRIFCQGCQTLADFVMKIQIRQVGWTVFIDPQHFLVLSFSFVFFRFVSEKEGGKAEFEY